MPSCMETPAWRVDGNAEGVPTVNGKVIGDPSLLPGLRMAEMWYGAVARNPVVCVVKAQRSLATVLSELGPSLQCSLCTELSFARNPFPRSIAFAQNKASTMMCMLAELRNKSKFNNQLRRGSRCFSQ
mmetsp:Transcript_130206/g.236611  ORF Transcript_130206/g.236611 Transcript_130206/m.236611 type:complete len:128 (-) Transcript_130206:11-394(-)